MWTLDPLAPGFRDCLEKPIVLKLVKKLSTFYVPRRCKTMFTRIWQYKPKLNHFNPVPMPRS
jgi:hypothetical protein